MVADSSPPTEDFIASTDGTRLFTRFAEPDGAPRATIVICHGFNAHSGHYLWAIEQFRRNGFAVTALDLRGRGQSDGERFYVDHIDQYVQDVSSAIEVARSRHPELPVYLFGHSAGGVTTATYTLDHQDRIAGFICEDFAFRVYAPDFALKLLEGASHLIPHVHVLKLPNEAFSRDPEWVAFLNSDPLIHNEVQPVETAAALARADERLDREFSRVTLPVLIIHGTADKATKPEGSKQFFDEAGSSDKTLKLYEGRFHDPLNDLGREEVMADILGWIDARVATPVRAEMPLAT